MAKNYLLPKNADKLNEKQSDKLQMLLENNSNLSMLCGIERAVAGALERNLLREHVR